MGVFQGGSLGIALTLRWLLGFSLPLLLPPSPRQLRGEGSFLTPKRALEALSEERAAVFSLPFIL